jgi:predicted transcriptional regulator
MSNAAAVKKLNEVAMTVRLDKDLRKAFEAVARSKDRSTSSLIREFMRESVKKNMSSAQMNLLK